MYALLRRLRSFRSFLTRKTASRSRRFSRFQRGRFIRDHFADEIRFWKLFPIGLRWLDSASIKVSTIITGHPTIVLQRDKTWNVYRVVRRNVHPFVCVHRSDLHEPLHESSGGNTFGKTGSSRRSLYNSILRSPFFLRFNAPRFCPRERARHPRIRFAKSNRSNDNYTVDETPNRRRLIHRPSLFRFLFFFCFIFDPLEGETRNLIRYSLDTLGWVDSRFVESQRWLGNDRNEIR